MKESNNENSGNGKEYEVNSDAGLTEVVRTLGLILVAIACVVILTIVGIIVAAIHWPKTTFIAILFVGSLAYLIRRRVIING